MSPLVPKGVPVFGAGQLPVATASASRAHAPHTYNRDYLQPDPRTSRIFPYLKPGRFKSVRGAFTSHDAAFADVDFATPPSAYNATYLKTANTRRYPRIYGPMTDAKAFAILRGTPEDIAKAAATPAPVHHTPTSVLETLKLLSKGDISDEQLETYEEDANRMRAYAALVKTRALTLEEQLMVD